MIEPNENTSCYASPEQRDVMLKLIEYGILEQDFFLTGGTALAVFYLHHRISNDFDFFTKEQVDMGQIDFRIKTHWQRNYRKVKDSQMFLSVLIQDVKVDFVVDPLSNVETRPFCELEPNIHLQLDSLANILSNKLTALASRTEPKDFVDFYYLCKIFDEGLLESAYKEARKKDAIFEDPPTSAYQIELGLDFLLQNPNVLPVLKVKFGMKAFTEFYRDLISWIYSKGTPPLQNN